MNRVQTLIFPPPSLSDKLARVWYWWRIITAVIVLAMLASWVRL